MDISMRSEEQVINAILNNAEHQIDTAAEIYADFHGVGIEDVQVTRSYGAGTDTVVRFRLSLDIDGRSRGCDEWYDVV